MPAYSQSTIQMRSPERMKFAFSRSLWQGLSGWSPRTRSIRSATSFASVNSGGALIPCASAVARYASTTRNASKRPAIGAPSWKRLSERAIPPSVSESWTSSCSTWAPFDEARDEVALRLEERDDLRRGPQAAAARVASCSMCRSIPSSSVSLPPIRTTNASPSEVVTLKFRFVIPPTSGSSERTPSGQIRSTICSGCIGSAILVGSPRDHARRTAGGRRRGRDRHCRRRVHGHAGSPAGGSACTPSSSSRSRSSTGSRAATTCSRWRWRWIRSPATRSRAGSAATATSGWSPTSRRCGRIPWLEGTALVLADVAWHDGSPVRPSPRQVLKAQVERAESLGYRPMFGSERVLLAQGHVRAGAREALPRVDAVRPVHPRLPRARDDVRRAVRPPVAQRHARGRDQGRELEGEAWPGQQEINFRFADAVTMADNHVIYKNGAKESSAHLNGMSITFMAKPRQHVDRQLLPHPRVALAGRRGPPSPTRRSSAAGLRAGSSTRRSWPCSSR